MGLNPDAALRENTFVFAHGFGLLLMLHTGRICMFGQDASVLFQVYVTNLVVRLNASGPVIEIL